MVNNFNHLLCLYARNLCKICLHFSFDFIGRTGEQIWTRYENLMKEYRKKLKEASATGAGEGASEEEDQRAKLSVNGSSDMFETCSEIESKVNPRGSVIAPAIVRDETGVVFKRPENTSSTSVPKREDIRKLCEEQTDTLNKMLNEMQRNNVLLENIQHTLSDLVNVLEPKNTGNKYTPQFTQIG